MYVRTYVRTCSMYIHTYLPHVCKHVHTYVRAYKQCIYVRMYIYIHTYSSCYLVYSIPYRAHSNITKLTADGSQLQSSLTCADNKRVSVEVELKHTLKKLKKTQQEKEELKSSLSVLQGKLDAVNEICDSKEQEIGSIKQRMSNLELERDNLFVNMSKLQDDTKLQGQTDAIRLSELHAQVCTYVLKYGIMYILVTACCNWLINYKVNIRKLQIRKNQHYFFQQCLLESVAYVDSVFATYVHKNLCYRASHSVIYVRRYICIYI